MWMNAAEESTLALASLLSGASHSRHFRSRDQLYHSCDDIRGIREDLHCCIECHHDVHLTDPTLLPDPGCERLLIRDSNEDIVLRDW